MTPPTPASRYTSNIPSLTALRFAAAAAVFAYHVDYLFLPGAFGVLTPLVKKGYLGVDFFFILSGFILTHVYWPRYETKAFAAREFLVRRLARIYPMHVLTLLIAAGIGLEHLPKWKMETSWPAFIGNALMVQSWGGRSIFSFNFPSWSISAEWFAYLLFPLLLPAIIKHDLFKTLLVVVWVYALTALATKMIFHLDLTDFGAAYSMVRIVPEFLLGMALCRLSRRYPWRWAPGWSMIGITVVLCAAIYLGATLSVCVAGPFLIIYAAAGIDEGVMSRWLTGKVPVYLGEISYAFYMIHALVLYAASRVAVFNASLWWAGLVFFATVVAASALHEGFEKPARGWVRRLGEMDPATAS